MLPYSNFIILARDLPICFFNFRPVTGWNWQRSQGTQIANFSTQICQLTLKDNYYKFPQIRGKCVDYLLHGQTCRMNRIQHRQSNQKSIRKLSSKFGNDLDLWLKLVRAEKYAKVYDRLLWKSNNFIFGGRKMSALVINFNVNANHNFVRVLQK